jgi:hypothetical protein
LAAEIRVYYEGDSSLKEGFRGFFRELREEARGRRIRFRLISGRSRAEACEDFGRALTTHRGAWNVLLIDSEGPLPRDAAVRLCRERRWDASTAERVFWMVQMMEAWFHADPDALEGFYGEGFRRNALAGNPRVEEIDRRDLERGLRAATRDTRNGDYFQNKTLHGSKLLGRIDPSRVRNVAPNCDRIFRGLTRALNG